jgi:hypothetical protein
MTDPRYTDPYRRQPGNATGWIIGLVVAVIVIVAVAWGMRDHMQTAGNPAPQTTGQSNPAPGTAQPGPPATNR